MQDQTDLFTIMECHFQQSISQTINLAVDVQVMDSGKSKYELFCAYYYWFLFSGWWFNGNDCTDVALNGKYNPSKDYGFLWYNIDTDDDIYPNRSEMKIRRIE